MAQSARRVGEFVVEPRETRRDQRLQSFGFGQERVVTVLGLQLEIDAVRAVAREAFGGGAHVVR